jgi:hypothetical protein
MSQHPTERDILAALQVYDDEMRKWTVRELDPRELNRRDVGGTLCWAVERVGVEQLRRVSEHAAQDMKYIRSHRAGLAAVLQSFAAIWGVR